jgi:hypothetical protein
MSRTLKVLKAVISGGRELKCGACGENFTCGVSLKGCWCSEVELTNEDRKEMREKYSDCLCRGCLEKQAGAGE